MSTESSSAEDVSTAQLVESIYAFAAKQLESGVSAADIKQNLVEQGLSADSANIVVTNLVEARAKLIQDAARKNMLYGGLWCGGGILVTALTYQAAAGAGGGQYVVAWGAILYGGIQFLRGVAQFSQN